MKNIETTIFPLTFVLCMCGLFVFEYPRGRPRLYFTVLYILISWLVYVYLILQAKTFIEKYDIILQPSFYCTTMTTWMFVVLNIYHHKRFKGCLKKLDIVLDTLEEFGMPKNYAQLRARIIWLLIGWIVSVIFVNIVDSTWRASQIPKFYVPIYTYVPWVLTYSINITMLNSFTFILLLRYIGTLFERVNQCIQKLIEQKKQQVRLAWTTCTSSSFMDRHLTDTMKTNQLVCLLMHVHFELSFISRELNTIFGLQIMMQMSLFHICAVQFIILLCDIVLVKAKFAGKVIVYISCIFLWSVRCILEIIVLNSICDGLSMKANRAEMFLNKLANLTFHVETQKNITQFLLQILRRPLRITAFGFYDYGYKFVQTFIVRAMQIIMIVLQTR